MPPDVVFAVLVSCSWVSSLHHMLAWRAGKGEREFHHQSRRSHTHLTRWELRTFGVLCSFQRGSFSIRWTHGGPLWLGVWVSESPSTPILQARRGHQTQLPTRARAQPLASPLPARGHHLQQAEKRADNVPPNENLSTTKNIKIEIKRKGGCFTESNHLEARGPGRSIRGGGVGRRCGDEGRGGFIDTPPGGRDTYNLSCRSGIREKLRRCFILFLLAA